MALGILLIKVFVVFNVIMGLASLCTWVERKGSALIQDRIGANRAGAVFEWSPRALSGWWPIFRLFLPPTIAYYVFYPFQLALRWAGILGIINTLLNDALKALFKEDFVPQGVSKFIHCLAPFMAVAPVFLAFAIVPLAPDFTVLGYSIRLQVAELNVGILFFLSMGSIAVYGVALAGWTGNNKFSLLGGLRAAAQMISYELAMGITVVTTIVMFGTADLYKIVEAQAGGLQNWGAFTMFPLSVVACVVLFIAGMAETKRGPFDLPESESELVAGYFTEYSGMKFLLFWLGEFAEIALFSLILTVLFFGGWHLPYVSLPAGSILGAVIGHLILMGKVVFLCVLQIVIRWTLPRFRYDQLMTLGWKYLLPLSMANLVASAAWKLWR